MPGNRRLKLPLFAFTASLLVHAIALLAVSRAIQAAQERQRMLAKDNSVEVRVMELPEEPPPEKPPEEPPLELGIDAPTPPTKTWIGYDTPEPQLAEKAPVEQAAFVDEPVAAAPPPSPPTQPSSAASATPPSPDLPPDPPAAEPAPAASPEAIAAQPAPEYSPSQPEEKPGVETQTAAPPSEHVSSALPPPDTSDIAPVGEAVKQLIEQIQKVMSAPLPPEQSQPAADSLRESAADQTHAGESKSAAAKQSGPTAPSPNPAANQAAHPPAPTPPAAPSEAKPQIAPEAQKAPREAGTPSDKESAPTSVIDIPPEQWKLGKPLARHGLVLKPRRPEFTLLTLLTAAPGNPLCQITFSREGVPTAAKLVRGSGDSRVDDAIVASLYRWRAEGSELQKLAEGKTLEVRIRIILNRRATDDGEE